MNKFDYLMNDLFVADSAWTNSYNKLAAQVNIAMQGAVLDYDQHWFPIAEADPLIWIHGLKENPYLENSRVTHRGSYRAQYVSYLLSRAEHSRRFKVISICGEATCCNPMHLMAIPHEGLQHPTIMSDLTVEQWPEFYKRLVQLVEERKEQQNIVGNTINTYMRTRYKKIIEKEGRVEAARKAQQYKILLSSKYNLFKLPIEKMVDTTLEFMVYRTSELEAYQDFQQCLNTYGYLFQYLTLAPEVKQHIINLLSETKRPQKIRKDAYYLATIAYVCTIYNENNFLRKITQTLTSLI